MAQVYSHLDRDYRKALKELRIALRGQPNDGYIWARVGYAERRLGNWSAVRAAYEKATRLNPRAADLFVDLGGLTFTFLRRYPEAVRAYDQSLALAPDMPQARLQRAEVYVRWKGSLDTLQAVLDQLPPEADLGAHGKAWGWQAELLLLQHRPEALLALLSSIPEPAFRGQNFYTPRALYAAQAYELRGDTAAARAAYTSACALLDSVIAESPSEMGVHYSRAVALAGLGRRREALREIGWVQTCDGYRSDAFSGPVWAEWCAAILGRIGQTNVALDEVERLLAGPSWLTAHTLRLDPRWDPIRENPRFKALLVKYANPERPAG